MSVNTMLSTEQKVDIDVDLIGEEIGICDNCDATIEGGEKVVCWDCFKKAEKEIEKAKEDAKDNFLIDLAGILGISLTERAYQMTLEDEIISKVTEIVSILKKIKDVFAFLQK